jgi:hypothetical protein
LALRIPALFEIKHVLSHGCDKVPRKDKGTLIPGNETDIVRANINYCYEKLASSKDILEVGIIL